YGHPCDSARDSPMGGTSTGAKLIASSYQSALEQTSASWSPCSSQLLRITICPSTRQSAAGTVRLQWRQRLLVERTSCSATVPPDPASYQAPVGAGKPA